MTESLNLQLPLKAHFFLVNELKIDRLLIASRFSSPAQPADVRAAIELLVPRGCTRELIRIGGGGDGAYLLPDDLASIEACFSPGVSTIVNLEHQLAADYGTPSYLCDASVEEAQLSLDAGK